MRYQRIKMAVIVICVLAAGICYSCGRCQGDADYSELPVLSAAEEETAEVEETDTGLVSTEAEQESTTEGLSVCYVHICGNVTAPGVYEMEEGSRIFQVVERAGGFTENAAAEYLNMAQVVSDGMKIVVPDAASLEEDKKYGEPNGNSAGSGISESALEKRRVNLNTATKEELMTLKGVGEAKADDIMRYREEHDGFQKIEDIMKISGIKDAAFQKIKDDITV